MTTPDPLRARWEMVLAEHTEAEAEAETHASDDGLDLALTIETQMYRTPAPDLAAVLHKMRADFMIRAGLLNDSVEAAIASLTEVPDLNDEVPVLIYRDLQRLAGVFDAAEWIEAYRNIGGDVRITPDGGLLTVFPDVNASDRDIAHHNNLLQTRAIVPNLMDAIVRQLETEEG